MSPQAVQKPVDPFQWIGALADTPCVPVRRSLRHECRNLIVMAGRGPNSRAEIDADPQGIVAALPMFHDAFHNGAIARMYPDYGTRRFRKGKPFDALVRNRATIG